MGKFIVEFIIKVGVGSGFANRLKETECLTNSSSNSFNLWGEISRIKPPLSENNFFSVYNSPGIKTLTPILFLKLISARATAMPPSEIS